MRIYKAITFCVFLSFIGQAQADTWAQQQEQYNESSRLRDEAFRQNEENEELLKQNKKMQEEMRRQNEAQQYEMQKMKEQQENALKKIKEQEYEREKSARELRNKEYKAGTEEENKKITDIDDLIYTETGIYFDIAYYRQASDEILKKGFSTDQTLNIIRAHKQYLFGIAKAALRGDSEAQVGLGDHYRVGRGVQKSEELAVKWFQKAAQQGSSGGKEWVEMMRKHDTNNYDAGVLLAKVFLQQELRSSSHGLSPDENRRAFIKALKFSLEEQNDNIFSALAENLEKAERD